MSRSALPNMWRDSERIAVGTCPPLVASSVLLGGMNVWLEMWHTRPFVIVDGSQMLAAAAISLPYVFVSRAIFPGAEGQQERSLEEHYLKHRHLILVLLAIPTVVSVASHMLLDGVRYQGWEAWWSRRGSPRLCSCSVRQPRRPARRAGSAQPAPAGRPVPLTGAPALPVGRPAQQLALDRARMILVFSLAWICAAPRPLVHTSRVPPPGRPRARRCRCPCRRNA